MKTKIIIGTSIILIAFLLILLLVVMPYNNLSKLEEYNLLSDEAITAEFKIKNKTYVLTTYQNSNTSYAYNNLLLKYKDNYYLLERIDKCDMSYLVEDNNIYIHCIGKKGDILKYTINGENVKNEVLEFNYKNTPNISQIHIVIDKVDNEYLYLKSAVKKDDSIKEGEHIKCSLSNKICKYEN